MANPGPKHPESGFVIAKGNPRSTVYGLVVARTLRPKRMSPTGPRATARFWTIRRRRLPMWEDIRFVIPGVRQTRHAMRDTPTPTGMTEPVMKLKSSANGNRRKKTTRLKVHRARFSSASSSSTSPLYLDNSCNYESGSNINS